MKKTPIMSNFRSNNAENISLEKINRKMWQIFADAYLRNVRDGKLTGNEDVLRLMGLKDEFIEGNFKEFILDAGAFNNVQSQIYLYMYQTTSSINPLRDKEVAADARFLFASDVAIEVFTSLTKIFAESTEVIFDKLLRGFGALQAPELNNCITQKEQADIYFRIFQRALEEHTKFKVSLNFFKDSQGEQLLKLRSYEENLKM